VQSNFHRKWRPSRAKVSFWRVVSCHQDLPAYFLHVHNVHANASQLCDGITCLRRVDNQKKDSFMIDQCSRAQCVISRSLFLAVVFDNWSSSTELVTFVVLILVWYQSLRRDFTYCGNWSYLHIPPRSFIFAL